MSGVGSLLTETEKPETYMGVSKNRGTPKWMVYHGNWDKNIELVVSTHLKNMLVKLDRLPRYG